MTFEPGKSSHVEKVDYDPVSNRMTVKFKNSEKPYTHGGVPPGVFDGIKRAPSAGSFYHRFVKRYKLL